LNQAPAFSFCLSIILHEHHRSENRFPLFRIRL
jgi:hypothetical protein